VWLKFFSNKQSLRTIAGSANIKAHKTKACRNQITNARLVIDNENALAIAFVLTHYFPSNFSGATEVAKEKDPQRT
jgi:hypothetical protein